MQSPQHYDNDDSRQLTILVDGLPLRGATPASYVLQAALDSLTDEQHALLEALRARIGPEIGIIDSHFDDSPLLFSRLGFRTRRIAGEDLGDSGLRMVAISCPHRHARLDDIDTFRFLQRGGVLLSSDRALQLPGIACSIGHLGGRPPARARLALAGALDQPASGPVWLDAGHLPIDPASLDKYGSVTLALDTLTGDPLAVYVPVQTQPGGILHSVAHWLQTPHPDLLTSVERRPLQAVPGLRAIGNAYPGLRLGHFLAQRSMIEVLLQGLARLLGVEQPVVRTRAEGRK